MIKRIEIVDFMAHRHSVLEPDPGVTVLTGSNNTGKSAVVEALRSIAENPPGKALIRHGCRQALVRVELESGEVVAWERTASRAIYRVQANGHEEVYAKFNRTPPQDVRALLRMDPIETETGDVDIHIGNQRTPIFLLDQSGAQAASFFAASTEAEYLLRMQQALKSRTDAEKRRRKELDQQHQACVQALERYAGLEQIEHRLNTAEALHRQLERDRKALPLAADALAALIGLQLRLQRLGRTQELLRPLATPPPLQDAGALAAIVQALLDLGRRRRAALRRGRALASLAAPPPLERTADLQDLFPRLRDLAGALERGRRSRTVFLRLQPVPEPSSTGALERDLERLRRAELDHRRTESMRKVLEPLSASPDVRDMAPLRDLVRDLVQAQENAAEARRRAGALAGLRAPPAVDATVPLADLSRTLGHRVKALARLGERLQTLGKLHPPTDPLATRELSECLGQFLDLDRRRSAAIEDRARIDQRLAGKRDELKALVERAGVCPVCRRPFDLDHLLETGHER